MLSCRDMAPWLSIHSPTTKWGERWWRQPPKGECISSPAGRLYGFRRQRWHKKWRPKGRHTFPAGTVSQPIGKPFNGQAKGLLWLTWRSYAGPPQYYIPPEGESPQPVREASAGPGQNPGSPGPKGPAAGSTLTPVRACQPSGIRESTAPVPIPTAPKGAIDLTAPFCGEISPLRFAPVEMTMGRPPAVPIPIPIPTAPQEACP